MIYLLEDDESIRELVSYTLGKTGTPARGFALPSEFYAALREEIPELVILDVMLPEEDGLTVLSRLRRGRETENLPVIMLTAKGSEYDKVSALDAGADDYIVKPFGIMELVARVKAVLRRSAKKADNGQDNVFSFQGLVVNLSSHEVTCDGEAVVLTFKEFELLAFLFSNRGVVHSRDRILREIWGYEFDGENRTVDVHIRTLRSKLGRYCDVIETVRGVGYKIAEVKR